MMDRVSSAISSSRWRSEPYMSRDSFASGRMPRARLMKRMSSAVCSSTFSRKKMRDSSTPTHSSLRWPGVRSSRRPDARNSRESARRSTRMPSAPASWTRRSAAVTRSNSASSRRARDGVPE
ncbi:hypothetical protein D3C83_00920 [compost metagenome]